MIFTWLPFEAFVVYKIFLKYPQEFFLSENALLIMQKISLINDKNQEQSVMPPNLIGSTSILFDIRAAEGSGVWYVRFFH